MAQTKSKNNILRPLYVLVETIVFGDNYSHRIIACSIAPISGSDAPAFGLQPMHMKSSLSLHKSVVGKIV